MSPGGMSLCKRGAGSVPANMPDTANTAEEHVEDAAFARPGDHLAATVGQARDGVPCRSCP